MCLVEENTNRGFFFGKTSLKPVQKTAALDNQTFFTLSSGM